MVESTDLWGRITFFRSTCELLEVRSQLLVLNEPGVTQKMMAAGVSAVDGLADLASPSSASGRCVQLQPKATVASGNTYGARG